jgi:hypothetical protein
MLPRLTQALREQHWATELVEQVVRTNDVDVWTDVDLAQLAADPKLDVALNLYATSSVNQLQVAMLQQKKALAVSAILESGAGRSGGKAP